MTVAAETPINTYTANGSTSVFAFTFRIENESELKIYIGDVEQTSGFTVSGVGINGGGSVTFTTNPSNGAILLFLREMTSTRTIDYQNSGDFKADTVNEDLDRVWLKIQEIERELNYRVFQFKETELRNPTINTLPPPNTGQVLAWQADGSLANSALQNLVTDITITGPIDARDSLSALLSDPPDSNVAFIHSYYDGWAATTKGPTGSHFRHKTGSTNTSPSAGTAVSASSIGGGDGTGSTTGQSAQIALCWDANGDEWKLSKQDEYSAYIFGAVWDNSTDDYQAIQDAINFAENEGYGTIVLPVGEGFCGTSLTASTPIRVKGQGLVAGATRQGTSIRTNITSGILLEFQNSTGSFDNGLQLEDFILVGPASGSAQGLKVSGGVWTNTSIKNITVRQMGGAGIVIDDCLTANFEKCRAQANGSHGFTITGSNGLRLIGCMSESNGG